MKKTSIEQIAYGSEPIFDKHEYSQTEFINALNWYTYNATHDDIKRYVLDYVVLELPEALSTLSSIPKTLFPTTLGALTRMLDRNFPSSPYILQKIDKLLQELLASTYEKELLKSPVEKKVLVKDRVGDIIAEIDGFYDCCLESEKFPKKDYDKYVGLQHASKKEKAEVAEYYGKLLLQLNESDDYNFSSKLLREYVTHVESVIKAFSAKVRKERKAKPVDLNKLVSKVKYRAESDILGLKSINPKDCIGMKYLLLWDEIYRKLHFIVAEDTLTIRGSTIYGIDFEKSITKIVKKPEIIKFKFMKGDNKYVRGSFDLLNTKASVPTGALNNNIVILRVIE